MMAFHLLLVISQITSAAGYCYSRNGTTLLNAAFQPCNNTTKYSACCMTNHSGAGDIGIADDVCMENGLCQNYAVYNGNNEGEQVWSRQGCTDPLWNSPYCLGDVCNKPEYADKWGNVGVHNCGGENWCCGEKTCCNDESNIFELAATVGPISTIISATPSVTPFLSATPSSSAITLSTLTPTPSSVLEGNVSSGGLSAVAKAGIGVGIAVFVILAAGISWMISRSRNSSGGDGSSSDESTLDTDLAKGEMHQSRVHAHELWSNHGYGELGQRENAELMANNAPQELEGISRNVRTEPHLF
ncbi:hypothetical protein COCVIDRAFT_42485 [Bipolaris victoriae FI3]|uniref:Mid2 domain-containing protein n=1 Tax=Bipolaris victoriae (strain FI3) TaxID=930091 RepID=W7DU32_BIPV3|nr:hypothetical protein COCVIDRAFT_42485 [Bipolaris victoriae FI3]